MRKIKVLSLVLAAIMLISSMSMLAIAEGSAEVTDYESLVAAVADGGEITIGNSISFDDTITVTKDTTINFGPNLLYLDNSYLSAVFNKTAENMFVVSGAKLTLNLGTMGRIDFMGTGSTFKVAEGAELVINGGSHNARGIYNNETNEFDYPASYIYVSASDAKVLITEGGYSVERLNASNGPIFSGEKADLKIEQGNFGMDVSEYVAEGSIIYSYDGFSEVLRISEEPLDEVNAFLNENGELVFKRTKPTDEMSFYLMVEKLYYDSWDALETYYIDIVVDSFDTQKDWAYFKVCDKETSNLVQTIRLPIVFEYNEDSLDKISDIIDSLPKGEETPEGYIPYCYKVNDLEVFNFWLTCTEDNYYTNINSFINYSDEFKKNIGYKNFAVEMRYGADERLYTFAGGTAEFLYDGVAYGMTEIEVKGEHIFYVPDATENTPEALFGAVQKRFDDYLGSGQITVEYLGTALDVLLKDTYEGTRFDWEQIDPDMTFDEWKATMAPPIDVEGDLEIEGVTDETPLFAVTINGIEHQFVVFRDSSKMVKPQYKSVDMESDVTVELQNGKIPLDTLVYVDILTSGTIYDKIQETLKAEQSKTFDINLYSKSVNDYISRLDGNKFEVMLPIPEDFDGKDLEVCYVHDDGEVEEFSETIENGYIKFQTNHFSAYTLVATEKTGGSTGDGGQDDSSPAPDQKPEDKFTESESSKTADTTNAELWAVMSVIGALLLAATVILKKKLKA